MNQTTMRAGGGQCSGHACHNRIGQGDTCYHESYGDSGKLYCADCGTRLLSAVRACSERVLAPDDVIAACVLAHGHAGYHDTGR